MRLRFLARHPLCGRGVTSSIDKIFRPAFAMERIEDSRPEPAPLMRTLISFMPWRIAATAALSPARMAAKGVLLRVPLKPIAPEDPVAIVFPSGSAIVTIVLLNDAKTCATPRTTFFFAFFWALSHELFGLYAYFIPLTDFLPATVFFGPLRVRAFVFVFWPLTGSPLRWRMPR